MSMGVGVDIYVFEKENENCTKATSVAYMSGREEWDEKSVLSRLAEAEKFAKDFRAAVKKYGAKNLCVRGNR